MKERERIERVCDEVLQVSVFFIACSFVQAVTWLDTRVKKNDNLKT